MQRHTPVLTRMHTDGNQLSQLKPNKSNKLKKESVSKKGRRKDIFNFDKFVRKLRLETIKTERFTSPNKTLFQAYDREIQNSSKSRSRHHTKSIQSSRERSTDTYRKKTLRDTKENQDPRSRSKTSHSKIKSCLKMLRIPKKLEFKDLASQIFNKFTEVQRKLSHSKKQQTKNTLNLCVKYRELFGCLVKSMIYELNLVSDEKQSQMLSNVQNIATLQNSIIQKQNKVESLQSKMQTINKELQSCRKIIKQQNEFIAEASKKETRVSKLLYAMRKRGIDVDQIYITDVQTPISDSGLSQEREQQVDEPDREEFEESYDLPAQLNLSY